MTPDKLRYDTKKSDKFYQDLRSGKFATMVKENIKGQAVENSKELFNIMKPLTAQKQDVEQFWVLYLDAQNHIIEISKMFTGSITSAGVYPREVVKKVLSAQAAAVILCHNHPSGDPGPSPEDLSLTFQLLIALSSIGVTIHEHLIVGDGGRFYSMADQGNMARLRVKYDDLTRV